MSDENVVFENDRVRVSRVRVGTGETHEGRPRSDRVLVCMTDVHQVRRQTGQDGEEIQHKAGDVIWREASRHEIRNLGGAPIEMLIVEVK